MTNEPKIVHLLTHDNPDKQKDVCYWCPGCEKFHWVPYENNHITWSFNGDLEKPTLSPSIRHRRGEKWVCHYFIRNGNIEFCGDCSHSLAGQSLPLEARERPSFLGPEVL